MTGLDSEELMRTYLERVVAGSEIALIDDLAHEDMVDEANQFFGGPPGRAGLVAHVVGFHRCIGDLAVSVERIVGNADAVMGWWSFAGRHVGPWLGLPPTGEPITATVFSFFELDDGRIRRYRVWLCGDFDPQVVFDSSRPVHPDRPHR